MTPEQIADGFTKIESAAHLDSLKSGRYKFVMNSGFEYVLRKMDGDYHPWSDEKAHVVMGSSEVYGRYIGFRHIPEPSADTTPPASVQADTATDGFVKKTRFTMFGPYLIGNTEASRNDAADHLRECHTELDNRWAVMQSQQKLINDGIGLIREGETIIEGLRAELSELRAAREWKPITVETLEPLVKIAAKKQRIICAQCVAECTEGSRSGAAFYADCPDAKSVIDEFRALTAASDFTPPEPKTYTWNGKQYTREELPPEVVEQARAIVEAVGEETT